MPLEKGEREFLDCMILAHLRIQSISHPLTVTLILEGVEMKMWGHLMTLPPLLTPTIVSRSFFVLRRATGRLSAKIFFERAQSSGGSEDDISVVQFSHRLKEEH